MLVGGLVAGQGQIDLFVLIAIVWAAAVAGDVTSYTLGRKLGRNWLLRHGERLKITEERLHQVETFFEKRGGLTILIGRFIGLVRALAPFIAGTSKMPLRQFLPYDIIGAGAWATTFCVLGYVFWQSFDRLTQYVSRGLFAFGTVVAVGLGLYFLVRLRNDPGLRRKVHAWLHEREDKAWVRLVLKVAGPAWRMFGRPAAGGLDATARFGLGRLTPGNLGLELTTLIAIAGVGAFTVVLIGRVIGEQGEPRIDQVAFDIADTMRFEPLTSIVEMFTHLGSSLVMGLLVLVTMLFALQRRRWIEAAALAAGAVLSFASVHILKERLRPAPAGRLAGGDVRRRLPVRPRGLRGGDDRVRDDPRPGGRRLGRALGGADDRRRARGARRAQPRLPARALPHGRARRGRAGARGVGARRDRRPVRRGRSSQ